MKETFEEAVIKYNTKNNEVIDGIVKYNQSNNQTIDSIFKSITATNNYIIFIYVIIVLLNIVYFYRFNELIRDVTTLKSTLSQQQLKVDTMQLKTQ